MTSVPPNDFMDGIGRDYREKIDKLHEAHVASTSRKKIVGAAAGIVLAGLASLVTYLWKEFISLDVTLQRAKEDIAAAASGVVVPVGTVVAWSVEIPDPRASGEQSKAGDWHYHWRACDGKSISASEHPVLAALLGNTYETSPTDPGMVMLPNFRNHFLRGRGEFSNDLGIAQADTVGPHTHGGVLQSSEGSGHQQRAKSDDGGHSTTHATGSNTDRSTGVAVPEANETHPKNYAIHWIIRVR